MTQEQIAFLHIPKTAGVSVRNIIGYHFDATEIAHTPDHLWKDKAYAQQIFQNYRFVHGHFLSIFLEDYFGKIRTVTFLREPVSRVVSLYRFLKTQNPDAVENPIIRERILLAGRLKLDEFLDSAGPEVLDVFENEQSKRLGARSRNDDWASMARDTLELFDHVGIVEEMDESMSSLCAMFCWRPPSAVPWLNVTERRREELSDATRRRLQSLNAVDMEIYELGRRLLSKRKADATRTVVGGTSSPRLMALCSVPSTRYGYRLTMGHAICGEGWYEREGMKTGQPWRFAEFGSCSRLDLRLSPESSYVVIAVIPFWKPWVDEKAIQVYVDGAGLKTQTYESLQGIVLVGFLRKEQLKSDGSVELVFGSDESNHRDISCTDKRPDDRPVSFALREIKFVAVDDSWSHDVGAFVCELLSQHVEEAVKLKQEMWRKDRYIASLEVELKRARGEISK